MFEYRWVKILGTLYDLKKDLKKEELVENLQRRGASVEESTFNSDLTILEEQGYIKMSQRSGKIKLTEQGKRKIEVVRRGY